MIGQGLRRTELEAAERDMRAVEVDRGDLRRIGGQVGEDVAPARGDRHHVIGGAEGERLHVDRRVLPDLRVDQAAEGEGEQPFEGAGARQGARDR